MAKARMNITVDLDVLLAAKTKSEFNISAACNEFLRAALSIDEFEGVEQEVVQALEEEKLRRQESERKIIDLQAKIQAIKSQTQRKQQELIKKALFAREMDEAGHDPRRNWD